jgi:predicted amidohydrolase/tetratricopeptide (TPR) repeat protein
MLGAKRRVETAEEQGKMFPHSSRKHYIPEKGSTTRYPMPSNPKVESALERAKEKEKEYNWLEAAKLYEKALNFEPSHGLHAAETWQNIGFCYSRSSQQAEDLGGFKRLRQLAATAYKTAAKLFEKEGSLKSQGKSAQCLAIAEYASSWLLSDSSERKERLEKCQEFAGRSLGVFEDAGDGLNYAMTCNTMLLSIFELLNVASDEREKQTIGQEGIDCAEKAISILSKLGNKGELVLTYSGAVLLNWYVANISEQEEKRERLTQKSLRYSEKAVELSKEVTDPYYAAISRWAATLCTLFFTENIESSLEYAEEMLQQGSTLRDNYLKGIALYLLAYVTDWMVPKEVTPDKKKERLENIAKFAEEAVQHLELVCQDSIIAETYSLYAESCSSLARDVEVSIDEKRTLLGNAIETGRKGLEHATCSGSPDAIGTVLHALSKALHFCSDLEPRKEAKMKLLGEALTHRREYIKIVERTFPSNEWVVGVGKYYAGLLESELSRLETDKNKKMATLRNAISDMEEGISSCTKWISSRSVPSLIAFVAEFEDNLGGMLDELYFLTEDARVLTRAISAYDGCAAKFKKIDLPSRVAESYWKIGRNKDHLGKHQEAAELFLAAFTQYKDAAEKIHQFGDFYLDYAVYMEAWSEIEQGKSAHGNEEYTVAKSHYEKAANLLKQSKMWGYLSSNFNAWSLLENAEDLSRKEKSVESIEAFKKAAGLFENAKSSIEEARVQPERSEVRDEKEMTGELVEISDIRREYCLGRVDVEDAKILDGQGDHAASSRKYGSAAQRFQKAADASGHETDRNELKPIICLCRAWQTMTRAEAEASPDLYLEASKLFTGAKEYSSNERTKLLAMGHSQFCRALEAGTRFEDTRDATLHLTTTQHLESAANYYIKAGFKTASEYAIATQRLFDGYIYMDNASKETDPEKRAKYYTIAEKVLQTSAESYLEARHPEKAKQVQRLLDKVREKRELAASLTEVLHAPTITSSTASFITPTPTHEKAVGLERFEHANIQGHLTVPEEVPMEEDLGIQLDLVNVAKNFGLLVRIDNLIPKGFQLTEASPDYVVENGSINLGGKRFEPLKVESIKISARATDFGIFKVSPKVTYIDEAGQFRTCVPEAVHVKVLAPKGRLAEERARKKYEIVYRDLLMEHPKSPKNECRVAIAQIGVSTSGDVVTEFYEEKAPGIFGLRPEKVETVRSKMKSMIEAAHAQGVNVLLFPELTVDLNYSELLNDVTSLAKAYQMYIIPGSYHVEKTKRNISVVLGPDGILWQQEKHIPAVIHHEGKRLNEGIDVGALPRKTIVCNTEFGRMAILICRDFLDMDLRVELKNFEPAVDLVFNPAFTPVTADFRAAHFDARRSIYAYCFFANVAEFGDSFIYTPEKERVERMIPAKEESIIYKDVDVFSLRSERKKWEKEKKQFIQSTR